MARKRRTSKNRKKDKDRLERVKENILKTIKELEPELRKQYEYLKNGGGVNPTLHGLIAQIIVKETRSYEEFISKLLELAVFIDNSKVEGKIYYTRLPEGYYCTCGYKAVARLEETRNGAPYMHQHLCPIGLVIAFTLRYSWRTLYLARHEAAEEAATADKTVRIGRYILTAKRVPRATPVLVAEGRKPFEENIYL